MQFYTAADVVDTDTYAERLNRTGEIYVDLGVIHEYAMLQGCRADTLRRLCVRYMAMHSDSRSGISGLDSAQVLYYLQEYEGVPQSLFRKKGVQSESLDAKKVLAPMMENGYAQDFLRMYIEHRECITRARNMKSLITRVREREGTVNGWDEKLTPVSFTANQTKNLRFNYSRENIVTFPRDLTGMVKARDGYVLAWGDFAQSDARIVYNLLLRDETNIAYINAFPDDIYAGFANWVRQYQRQELQQKAKEAKDSSAAEQLARWTPFRGFKGKEERDAYKLHALETIYGTRHHKVSAVNTFIQTFAKVLNACPRYRRYYEDVKRRANLGIPIRVSCYMGHVEYVPAYTGNMIASTQNDCLNYPVQGGTSEIMILTTNRILDRFYALGYGEDDVHVYYIRHDEPIFELKKSAMKDSWVMKDFETIQVDDWIPLKLAFEFGRTYGDTDAGLMEDYHLSSKINAGRMTVCKPKALGREYYPLEKLLELSMQVLRAGNGERLISVYDAETNSGTVRAVSVPDDTPDAAVLQRFVNKYAGGLYRAGYRTVVVYNDSYYEDLFDGDVPILRLFRQSQNVNVYRARLLGLSALAKMGGAENPAVESNLEWLATVGRYELFGGGSGEDTQSAAGQA